MEIIAKLIGYAAMATVFCSLQVKNPKGTLWVMAAATGLFAIHFALLGAITGAILNTLNVIRNLAILFTDRTRLSGKIAMGMVVPAFFAAPFVFWAMGLSVGILDFVLGAIMAVASYLFWSEKGNVIRIAHFFMVSPGWIVYNTVAGSLPGVVTECLNMLSVLLFWGRKLLPSAKKSRK